MKKIGFRIFYGIAIAVSLFNLVMNTRDSFVFSINDVPKGKFVEEIPSADGIHLLRVYRYQSSAGKAMRVSLTDGKETENIYWQAGIDTVDCHWVDDQYVQINEVKLDIDSTWRYDCRSGYSIFTKGSIEDMSAAEEQFSKD